MTEVATPEADQPRIREIDPFSFFHAHASAIPGFGGAQASPDPRYCLHTPYVEVAPGRAYYRLRIDGAKASRGELAVRVHAFRAEGDADAQMAAGSKVDLAGLDHETIDQAVRFNALEGVHYALFVFVIEPTDLTAESIHVTLEEMGDAVPLRANRGREVASRFAKADYATSHRLIAAIAPSPKLQLSQAYVPDRADGAAWAAEWPEVVAVEPDPLRQWEAIAVLSALDIAGVDTTSAHGLLIDVPPPTLANELDRHGIDLEQAKLAGSGEVPDDFWSDRAGTFDFVVSYALAQVEPTPDARIMAVGDGLRCLRGRGVGLFLMPFWTGTAHYPKPAEAAACLDRNAVQQIALRLIGQSYSVSQLAFPVSDGGMITSFLLIAHKLA